MRVAMYYSNSDVRLQELPRPKIGPGELLVKVHACGICGSDVMEWYRLRTAPRVLGHEIAGEIVDVGAGVTQHMTGERVFVSHHVPCNTCHYCVNGHHTVCDTLRKTNIDPGGFSEFVRVPKINVEFGVFRLPDELSYEEGVFIEPLACVLRGLKRAGFRPGKSVLVLGSGISGLLFIALARAFGASRIFSTDISSYRLNAAQKFGADAVFHAHENFAAQLRELNNNRLPELVFVCTAAPAALTQALKLVDRGGTVLLFAPSEPGTNFQLALWEFWHDGITLTTTYAAAPADIMQTIELLGTQKVDVRKMITHRLPLAETGKGFQLVANAQESIKVIIEPQH